MGLGLFGGGEGAARYFASRGDEVTVTDLRDAETLAPAVEALSGLPVRYALGGHRDEDFASCDVLVVNQAVRPGNRYVDLARSSGARVTNELELGLERAQERGARVLAVTGSNGKSTTTAMLSAMMMAEGHAEAIPRGNVGGSLLAEVDGLPEKAALEVAVVTNFSPNHLDWHPTLEAYCAAKKRLIEMLPGTGRAVLNARDPVLREWGEGLGSRPVWFVRAGGPPADGTMFQAGEIRASYDVLEETLVAPSGLDGVAIRGPHDLENALAAAAAARAFGVGAKAIAKGLREYGPLEHRLQVVVRAGEIVFVDDSASTTPESTMTALESVVKLDGGPAVLIAGGSDKGLDFSGLARAVLTGDIPTVLLGEAGERLGGEIVAAIMNAEPDDEILRAGRARGEDGGTTMVEYVPDFDGAVRRAVELLGGRGTVLLSPAAASHDMFANYVERGRRFADTARGFAEEAAAPDAEGPQRR